MVGQGVLINTSSKGSPAHFVKGPNGVDGVLTPVNSASIPPTDPTVGVGQDEVIGGPIQPGFVPMRIHSLGHRFKVIEKPSKEVPWTRTTDCSRVPNHVLELPMGPEDDRIIKIVYREGKTEQSVTIWTPEVIITNPNALNYFPAWAGGRAQRIANWLSGHYGFKFGVIEAAQDFHYAIALPTNVAQAAKELGLKAPDLWMDTSRGRGEMETSDPEMAMQLHTLPARMAVIENVLPRMVTTLEKLADGQAQMVHQMEGLVDSFQQMLGKKPPQTSTTKTDLGGMFG